VQFDYPGCDILCFTIFKKLECPLEGYNIWIKYLSYNGNRNFLLNITIEQSPNTRRDQLILKYITISNKSSFRTIYNSCLDSTFNENPKLKWPIYYNTIYWKIIPKVRGHNTKMKNMEVIQKALWTILNYSIDLFIS